MSLILVPQVSGSVLPANVHQRVVYKKTATFHYILSIVSDLGQHRAHLGVDLEDRDPWRCGNLAPARLGTASIPARTVPSTSDHSRSTASASSSEPRACAALSSARLACAFAAFSLSMGSGARSKYASAFSAVA
jgi:hypothetical protein